MKQLDVNAAIRKVADRINAKRRRELIEIYSGNTVFKDYVQDARKYKTFVEGNKSKSMRKIASMPMEVDAFFSRVYGNDYYKEKDFFTKHAPEWSVIDYHDL
jgi:hypothetical protein